MNIPTRGQHYHSLDVGLFQVGWNRMLARDFASDWMGDCQAHALRRLLLTAAALQYCK
jgi:hypothetical protein